nr:pro-sigmaK processing inhibitor BofA family protein [uncultured Sellimonas sp.]
MKEKGTEIIVNFIVRAVLGAAVIFFVNQFLESQKISVAVGLNPLTLLTGGILGIPGVALLYGIVCWKIL